MKIWESRERVMDMIFDDANEKGYASLQIMFLGSTIPGEWGFRLMSKGVTIYDMYLIRDAIDRKIQELMERCITHA